MVMSPVHQIWSKPSWKAQWKGGRRRGRQRKRWEDNIRERTGLEFGKSQRAEDNREKWRKLVAKSSVVLQRPSRLRNWWWWWWWWWCVCVCVYPVFCCMWYLKKKSGLVCTMTRVDVCFTHAISSTAKRLLCTIIMFTTFLCNCLWHSSTVQCLKNKQTKNLHDLRPPLMRPLPPPTPKPSYDIFM